MVLKSHGHKVSKSHDQKVPGSLGPKITLWWVIWCEFVSDFRTYWIFLEAEQKSWVYKQDRKGEFMIQRDGPKIRWATIQYKVTNLTFTQGTLNGWFHSNFRQENPPGSRLDRNYLIKELDGICVMAHQREARTATTELLTRLTWFTLPGLEPATLGSIT